MNTSNDSGVPADLPVATYPFIDYSPQQQQQQASQQEQHRQVLRIARQLTHHDSLENFNFDSSSIAQQQQSVKTKVEPLPPADVSDGIASPATSRTTTSPVLSEHSSHDQRQRQLQRRQSGGRQRNYHMFPGRNKFFCGGRLITSREYGAFAVALVLLIAPCVLFAVFTCPFLWSEVHPAIPIVFGYMFILALVSTIKTSWSDPGIIPRDLDVIEDVNSSTTDLMPKEITIKGMSWTLKYCDTCRIYRPPRASHCRQCDNCVENEDHHCIWLNNCIGKRNYRSFFVCITSSTVLCLYIVAFCLVHMLVVIQDDMSFGYMFSQAPVSFVLAIVCFLLLFMVGGLTLYHCSLIMRGVTTHEQLRAHIMRAKDIPSNPYVSENPFINMSRVLCQPQPKRYVCVFAQFQSSDLNLGGEE
ncbi:DHHC palmitoyltransferase-domain-containing protein [Zychaea mexicana]|uniref:DHHC palmitoyltransferase-domain-containing protein n=1 Tax=Zychaea mexicana TaxID=64656 RepID=UPI0022FF3174|nr:DHHC palmitoyltransferase-domain-containing protein [Zychaea mexicana]KAI9495385.1 DHHC palmitoyltransferase-domain-containing protein [Zychaea mexicana]